MSPDVFFAVLLGLVFGSFGNVLVVRLKKGQSIGGRSHCMRCRKTLGFFDLIPVLSYVCLDGRCRYCRAPLSLQYPVVEVLSGFLFGTAATLFAGNLPVMILTAALLYVLLLSTVFDVLYQELPDMFTIAILLLGTILTLLSGNFLSSIYGFLLSLIWFGGQWILSRGRAIGTGDIFLACALGVWLGFAGTITMLLLSYVVGAAVVLLLLAARVLTWKSQRIAFGPFLATGAVLTLLGVGQSSVFFL